MSSAVTPSIPVTLLPAAPPKNALASSTTARRLSSSSKLKEGAPDWIKQLKPWSEFHMNSPMRLTQGYMQVQHNDNYSVYQFTTDMTDDPLRIQFFVNIKTRNIDLIALGIAQTCIRARTTFQTTATSQISHIFKNMANYLKYIQEYRGYCTRHAQAHSPLFAHQKCAFLVTELHQFTAYNPAQTRTELFFPQAPTLSTPADPSPALATLPTLPPLKSAFTSPTSAAASSSSTSSQSSSWKQLIKQVLLSSSLTAYPQVDLA
jgi:hypothetical protein